MPTPVPSNDESKDEFISRCIETEIENGVDPEQAKGMCYSIWEESKKSAFPGSLSFDLPPHLKR